MFLIKLFNKYIKYIKYIIVGGMTTLVNFIIYMVLRCLNVDIISSNTMAFIVAVLFAYYANKTIVFTNNKNHTTLTERIKEFVGFIAMRIGSFFIETILLYIWTSVWDREIIIKVIISMVTIIANYVISNKFIFR